MAKRTFKAGATSQTIDIFVMDSSSTVGAGLAALAFNTANLKAYYRKGATGSATAITLATQTVGGAWSSGGFVEIDATNMKGVYRFDVPDTILASSPWATLYFYGATNMAPVVVELEIVAVDPFDAVRMGLTALPNAAAEAAGGLYTRGSGAGQIAQQANGQVDVNLSTIKTQTVTCAGGVTVPAATLASTTNITAGTITTASNLTTNNDKTGYALTSGERNSVADAMLDRDMSTGSDSGSTTVRTVRQALRALRNKWTNSAGTYTVYKEDDATSSWTSTIGTDAAAVPTVSSDPAGP